MRTLKKLSVSTEMLVFGQQLYFGSQDAYASSLPSE